VAYLSRETVKWLKTWLEHAKISEGAIFRGLIGRTGRRMKVDADAVAICGENQCGTVRDGEGGDGAGTRRIGF